MKNNKATLYYMCLVIFLFQPILQNLIGVIKYFDEVFVLVFFIKYGLVEIRKKYKYITILKSCLVILIGVGIVGNIVSKSDQPIAAIIQDVYSNLKLIVFAISVRGVYLTDRQQSELSDKLSATIRFLFIILFLTALISQFLDIGMLSKERYGRPTYKFLYENPGILNTYYYYYMVIFSITLYKKDKLRKNSFLFMIIGVIPWVLTFRSRAIAFALLYFILFVYIVYIREENRKYKIRWFHVLLIIIALVMLGWDAIDKYFVSNERVSRYQLLRKSFQLAKDYFPFGTGFGTFGTQASRDYYSSIYYRYGLSNIYGLSPAHPAFVTDQYWFGILGQFGVLGVLIVGIVIYQVFKAVWGMAKTKKNRQLAALTLFYTSLFASFTAGSFIHTTIVSSLLIFNLFKQVQSKRQIIGPIS